MERDEVLNIRLPGDVKEALQRAAEDDRRSLSSFVVNTLAVLLTERGYLKPVDRTLGKGAKK